MQNVLLSRENQNQGSENSKCIHIKCIGGKNNAGKKNLSLQCKINCRIPDLSLSIELMVLLEIILASHQVVKWMKM